MTWLQEKETKVWGTVHNFGGTNENLLLEICLVSQVSDVFSYIKSWNIQLIFYHFNLKWQFHIAQPKFFLSLFMTEMVEKLNYFAMYIVVHL